MLDLIGSIIGLFGTAEFTSGIAVAITFARWRRHQRDAFVPLLMFVAVAIEAALKLTIAHPAPPPDLLRTVAIVPTVNVPFANSFPSGHVMRVTFLAAIAHGVPTWASLAIVLLMVVSRVYLAAHWLSDCVGGFALGLLVAGLAYALVRGPTGPLSPPRGLPGGPTRR